MAPATQPPLVVDSSPPRTIRPIGLGTRSSSTGSSKTSATSVTTIRHTVAGRSSIESKQPLSTTPLPTTTSTPKSSTVRQSMRPGGRSSTSTPTPAPPSTPGQSSTQTVPSTLVSSTSSLRPAITRISPDGVHYNISSALPPITQGQYGKTPSSGGDSNTSVIIAGVLVPLILIGVGAIIFYIWYRRKYPVRMVMGKDFSKFSNPAYNSRASTVTLLREDATKEWERINTLARKNPDLSMIDEEQPDGVDNRGFEIENDETDDKTAAENPPDMAIENTNAALHENINVEEETQNNGTSISRERPKTKKAVLVKTETVEDFENEFELVSESDLGQRTGSEASSGNESTETHTVSLSFSETFDDRYKDIHLQDDQSPENIRTENEDRSKADADQNEEPDIADTPPSTITIEQEMETENDTTASNVISSSNETKAVDSIDKSILQSTEGDVVSDAIYDKTEDDADKEIQNEMAENKLQLQEDDSPADEMGKPNANDSGDKTTESKDLEHSVNANDAEDQTDHLLFIPEESGEKRESPDDVISAISDQADKNEVKETVTPSSEMDTTFETLSDQEMNSMQNEHFDIDVDKSITKTNESEMGKEKTELLENGISNTPDALKTNDEDYINKDTSGQEISKEGDFVRPPLDNDSNMRKSFLSLSNEHIVLESVPQTPPVFVQESFILESEANVPVYLDNVTSPKRGRRAFTLNDIPSKHSFDFSLPKAMDEISKSSPVISDIDTLDFPKPKLDRKLFENIELGRKENHKREFGSEQNLTYNDDSQNQNVKREVGDINNDEMIPFDTSSDNFGKPANITFIENVATESFDSQTNDESNNSNETVRKDVINLNFETTEEDIISSKESSIDLELECKDKQITESNNDGLTSQGSAQSLSDLSAANVVEAKSTASDQLLNFTGQLDDTVLTRNSTGYDDSFFEDFPQSPISTAVDNMADHQTGVSERKTVIAQTFDFDNSSISDNESSTSDAASKNENIEDHGPTLSAFETKISDADKLATDLKGDPDKPTTNAYGIGSSSEATDSSTLLSFDIPYGEKSEIENKTIDIDEIDIFEKDISMTINIKGLDSTPSKDLANPSGVQNLVDLGPDEIMSNAPMNISSSSGGGGIASADISLNFVGEGEDNSEC